MRLELGQREVEVFCACEGAGNFCTLAGVGGRMQCFVLQEGANAVTRLEWGGRDFLRDLFCTLAGAGDRANWRKGGRYLHVCVSSHT